MSTVLNWRGPFGFTSRTGQPLLSASERREAGVYLWSIRTDAGPRAHYVGETGGSFATRHIEHFQAYASGVYNTRDADALERGEDIILQRGTHWRRSAPESAQPFIDDFELLARHTARTLELIEIYLAPLDADQRWRRRVEGGLVTALYAAPPDARRLFPDGYRVWKRTSSETALVVRCENPPAVPGFPPQFEA